MKRFLIGVVVLVLACAGSVQAGLADFVPQDSPLIVNFNIPRLMNVEALAALFHDTMGPAAQQKKDIEEFAKQTGIDLRKDIQNALVFLTTKDDPQFGSKMGGVLFEGKFEAAKIIKAVQGAPESAERIEVAKVAGFDAIATKGVPGQSVFLDGATVVVGNVPVVEAVAGIKGGKAKGLTANAAFANLLKKADPKAAMWGGMVVSPEWKKDAEANPVTAPLGNLVTAFFSFDYEKEFVFHFIGEVAKADNLAAVKGALTNYVDSMNAWAAGVPEFQAMLKTAKIEGDGTTAKLSMVVPKAQFADLWKKLMERAAAPKKDK